MMELILTIITLILLFTLNNKDGLYEPVKQKGGIPLQTNKKEE